MAKPTKLVRAVGYLRKSTKGQRDGKERQEKSISQQKTEINKLAQGKYEIVEWFTDDGVSGWKRDAKRPEFATMLRRVEDLHAEAIIVDNLDRFSRAAVDEVQEDTNKLRRAGVRWIVTVSHGEYDLGARYDIGSILKFVVAVWSSCEYSRQLSRRVTLARRNAALEGKRTGGKAPYGLAVDGKGSLKIGDPTEAKRVRQMFTWFGREARSLSWIANELNRHKVPAARGGLWSNVTVKQILTQRAYRGDFVFNANHRGKYHRIDDANEVVESQDREKARGHVTKREGLYKPLIDRKLFDSVQKRLESRFKFVERRKRVGYPLTGVLICGHCGRPLYGCQPGNHVLYRCRSHAAYGIDSCQQFMIREDAILGDIMRLLGEEVDNVRKLLTTPPENLRRPNKAKREERERLERERATLTEQIRLAEQNVMFSTDARTRQAIDKRLSAMRDELEALDGQLSEETPANAWRREDLEALNEWWREFEAQAVSVPVRGKVPADAHFYQDPASEEGAYLADPRLVNEALLELGCTVTIRWRTEKRTKARRYFVEAKRWQMGVRKGIFPNVRSAEPSETYVRILPLFRAVDRLIA